MGDGFYRSEDPTNSIKVLWECSNMKEYDPLVELKEQDESDEDDSGENDEEESLSMDCLD